MSTSTTTTAPQESTISRRFSLEQDFMYSRCDTQLYALLRCFSTAKPSSTPTPCYYFPYDYDGLYKLINKDLLRYLAVTTNPLSPQQEWNERRLSILSF